MSHFKHNQILQLLLVAIVFGFYSNLNANPTLTTGTWVNIGPQQVQFSNANSVFTQGMAIDPTDPNILYLCTDAFDPARAHAGLYKTTDGGSHWRRIGAQTASVWTGTDSLDEPIRVRIDPNNHLHLYTANGVRGCDGFYVSTDGGENFVMPKGFSDWAGTSGSLDVYDVAVDPTDFNHILLGFHSAWPSGSAGIAESKDGGNTWVGHGGSLGLGQGHSIVFLYKPELGIGNNKTWLWGTQGGGYWRTTDGGDNWTKMTDAGIQHGGGSSYYTKTGVLYVSGATNCLRSTDNGATFTPIGGGGGYNAIYGDGTRLYTMQCFGPLPYSTSLESDGNTWTNFNSQQFSQGPFEMACDHVNQIFYTASWTAGMWALKLPGNQVSVKAESIGQKAYQKTSSASKIFFSPSNSNTVSAIKENIFDIRGKRISGVVHYRQPELLIKK